MEEWRFVFEDSTSQQQQPIESGITDTFGSGIEKTVNKASKKTFADVVTDKGSEQLFEQTIVSPLNSATGGLANPIYRTTKRLISGGSLGVAGGMLAVQIGMMALQRGVEAIQKRIDTLEKQATSMNNQDNALIRAGSVTQATYYNADFFRGVVKTTNRR